LQILKIFTALSGKPFEAQLSAELLTKPMTNRQSTALRLIFVGKLPTKSSSTHPLAGGSFVASDQRANGAGQEGCETVPLDSDSFRFRKGYGCFRENQSIGSEQTFSTSEGFNRFAKFNRPLLDGVIGNP
jgi:hypothetical protein